MNLVGFSSEGLWIWNVCIAVKVKINLRGKTKLVQTTLKATAA